MSNILAGNQRRSWRPAWSTRPLFVAGGSIAAILLAVAPLTVAVASVAALAFGVVVLVEPTFGLLAAICSVPVQDAIALPGGLTVTQIVVVVAAGAWALRILAHPDRTLGLRWQWVWWLWLGWQLLTVVFSPYSLSAGFQQWARWLASWIAFSLVLGLTTDRRRSWWLIGALIVAPTVAALIGINQFWHADGPPSFLILGGRFARAAATFGKPNPFGGYLNMAWPLAGALGVYGFRKSRERGQWQPQALILGGAGLLTCGILLAGLFASYSRGGWIGAVLAIFGMALLAGRRSAVLALATLLLTLMIGLLGAFSVLPAVAVGRLQSITDNVRIFDAAQETVTADNFAVVERMAQWQAGWHMWQSSPLLGIGPGNYNTAYPDFYVGRWSESQGHAHNYYIHTLAESGVPGLFLYLILIGVMFAQGLRLRRAGSGTIWGAIGLGGCGIMLAVIGHNVFENLHVLNMGIQLSGVWALMIVGLRECGARSPLL